VSSQDQATREAPPDPDNKPSDPRTDGVDSPGDRQTLLREVNEEIERVNGDWEVAGKDTLLLCECDNRDCQEQIEIGFTDYERLRRFPTRFLVKPEHVAREGERIVEQNDGHVIVEKVGDAAVTAIQHDPRRTSRGDGQVQR
jgi:hypothetical protein